MNRLRSLYRAALEVRSTDGVSCRWPERVVVHGRRSAVAVMQLSPRPSRRAGNERLENAISVLVVCEACDSTGWMIPYLEAADESSQRVWESIPRLLYCEGCQVQRWPSQLRRNRCPRCKRPIPSYRELVVADMRDAYRRIRS